MSRLRSELWRLPRADGRHRAPEGTTAVVVGGGIAGIAAATVLCERGVSVSLIERERHLGGRAGAFEQRLVTGERVQMERGLHGFFRHYYNLRALLRRVDPQLASLQPLDDYPVLTPDGTAQSFAGLRTALPLVIPKLISSTPHLKLRDLWRIDKRLALAMLSYDDERTHAEFSHTSAAEYLDALGFPPRARRMLLDVFSHSFFVDECELSAAELLMMFHFYFTGNPEGLVFDVAKRPMSRAFWQPLAAYLQSHGVEVQLGRGASAVRRRSGGGFVVAHDDGELEADLLVLALDVAGLARLVEVSPDLDDDDLRDRIARLDVTRPFGVLRLWLDRKVAASRVAFAGTTGWGCLDNITVYERFQDESAAWSERHEGSVVELHAYALNPDVDASTLRTELIDGLHVFYPETRSARIVDERMLLHADSPGFPPVHHDERPTPATRVRGLALAGDFTRMPFPCALMERAAASGMLAASTLLADFGVASEPLRSVPTRGLLATPSLALGRRLRSTRTPSTPGWPDADPGWIRRAARRVAALPSGGWYVVDASNTIGAHPRRVRVAGRDFVAWRIDDALFIARDACPHMGASLADGRVEHGRLVCPWHGLELGPRGCRGWKPLPSHDDGVLFWVRLDHDGEPPTKTPILPQRPQAFIDAVVRTQAACDPRDVIANRLDPWHGPHFHPHAFDRVRVIDRGEDDITVHVAYRVIGRVVVECDARFHCSDPRTIVMTIVHGEGLGSVVETHATPLGPGRTAIIEATLATSDRRGFLLARACAPLVRPFIQRRAKKLWVEDAAYAERLYRLRNGLAKHDHD